MKIKKWFAINFTETRRISPWLLAFFENKTYTPKVGRALDIWFGIGQDSKYLAEKWYKVDAIDKDPIAIQKAKEFNGHAKVNFMQQDINGFIPKENYDLVIAFLSIFYLSKSSAKKLFAKIVEHMNIDGYLIMRLLWPQDDRREIRTTWDIKELRDVFEQYKQVKIVSLQESYAKKYTAEKILKNRHYVDIVVQKII